MPARRRHPRVDTPRDLVARRAGAGTCTPEIVMINISHSGTALVAGEPLGDIDDELLIELRPAGGGKPVRLSCQIRYVIGETQRSAHVAPRWLHGTRFEALDAVARSFVAACVEEQAVC